MEYKYTTYVPNILFDTYLPTLSVAELKLLLVVIRQTHGWVNTKTGIRKTRDRISHSQFMTKTGLSRRVISKTVHALASKGLIVVTDFGENILHTPQERRGKLYLYYTAVFKPMHKSARTCAHDAQQPVHKSAYNKTNYTKLTTTKRENEVKAIGAIIETIKKRLQA